MLGKWPMADRYIEPWAICVCEHNAVCMHNVGGEDKEGVREGQSRSVRSENMNDHSDFLLYCLSHVE